MERHRLDYGPERKSCSVYVLEKNRQVCISDLRPIFHRTGSKSRMRRKRKTQSSVLAHGTKRNLSWKGRLKKAGTATERQKLPWRCYSRIITCLEVGRFLRRGGKRICVLIILCFIHTFSSWDCTVRAGTAMNKLKILNVSHVSYIKLFCLLDFIICMCTVLGEHCTETSHEYMELYVISSSNTLWLCNAPSFFPGKG